MPRVLGPPLNHRRPWQSPGPREARADFLSGPKSPLRRAGIPARECRGCRPPHRGPVPPAEGTAARPPGSLESPQRRPRRNPQLPHLPPHQEDAWPSVLHPLRSPNRLGLGSVCRPLGCAAVVEARRVEPPDHDHREIQAQPPSPPRDRGRSRTLQSSSLAMELSPRRYTGSHSCALHWGPGSC